MATTLYLDKHDVIKLRDTLADIAHPANAGSTQQAPALSRVLRRLATTPLTFALCDDTGIDQTVTQLHEYRNTEVAELAKRVSDSWVKQLAEEEKQKDRAVARVAARTAPPAPPPPRQPLGCPACRGRKRKHTCGTMGKDAQKQRTLQD